MVRRSLFIAGVTFVLGSIAVTASAQPGGGGPGFFGGMLGGGGGLGGGINLMLLRTPEVQKELKLTPDQTSEISTLQGEVMEKVRASFQQVNFQDLQNASDEERQKLFTDMRKKAEEATKGVDDKVSSILDATQSKRLHELLLQRLGPAALTRPEVVKQLNLTDDQVAKITKIQTDARPQFPRMDPNQSPEDRQAAMQKMRDQFQKSQKDMLAVLSDDQMLDWTNMCGKTFKFPPMQFGRGNRQAPPPQ
jgi:Spy/CpxP family protein refolding chaperone